MQISVITRGLYPMGVIYQWEHSSASIMFSRILTTLIIIDVVDREFSICIFCSSICFHYLWGLFSDARAQSRTFGRGV